MGLKEFYYNLEDKYFEMLDNLEEKGINLYKIIDPLEKNGIPTFPIFSIIVLALVALIIFLLISNFTSLGTSDDVRVAFFDETSNKIANTDLVIKLDGVSQSIYTDSSGVVNFSDLDKTKLYELELDDPNYKLINRDYYNLNPTEKYHKINIERIEYQSSKTITFKKHNGELNTESLEVTFYCSNSDYSKTLTVTTGEVTLRDIPLDCGTLHATISGRNDYTESISGEGTSGEIRFSESTVTATLTVSVKDKDSSLSLANMNVTIIDEQQNTIDTGTTNQNGLFVSENVIVNKQYFVLVSDPNAIYASISQLDYLNNLLSKKQITTGTNSLELKIKKEVVGFIQLKVTDRITGEPIEGATATISKSAQLVDTKTSDSTGLVKFAIKENTSYLLKLDKTGYLLETRSVNISPSVIDITLKSLTDSGMSPVNISVIDNERKPIEYATVKIWDAVNNEILKVVTTDIYGKVTITNLNPEHTYFAEAVTGKFTGKSNNFSVSEREIKDEIIIVNIGQGTYNLVVMDESQNPISTTINVYDAQTNKEMTEKDQQLMKTVLQLSQ